MVVSLPNLECAIGFEPVFENQFISLVAKHIVPGIKNISHGDVFMVNTYEGKKDYLKSVIIGNEECFMRAKRVKGKMCKGLCG